MAFCGFYFEVSTFFATITDSHVECGGLPPPRGQTRALQKQAPPNQDRSENCTKPENGHQAPVILNE